MTTSRLLVAAGIALAAAAVRVPAPVLPVAAAASEELPEGRHGGYVATAEQAPPPAAHVHADGHVHVHAAARPPARPAVAAPAPVRRVWWDGKPFATPEAAMRFLVSAYNARDDVALRHVTTPDQRSHLVGMRDYAPTLRLTSCTRLDTGAYDCEFWHSVAQELHGPEGYATFRVAPATRPGWYMTILLDCGDAES